MTARRQTGPAASGQGDNGGSKPCRRLASALLVAAAIGLIAAPALAEPTAVTVRVISQDAKFVGDHTGGAAVTLREAGTGRVLARGKTGGGTGDTARIMQASGRSPLRASPDAAAFAAVLDIAEPTLVELVVRGPLGRPGSAITVTAQRWMMPGEAVTDGDGWVIELPGLSVTPAAMVGRGELTVTARVEPHCGCPIAPEGLWRAGDYRVSASLWSGRRRISEVPLAFATAPGGFAGTLPLAGEAPLTLVVFARNVVTGTTGLARIPVRP